MTKMSLKQLEKIICLLQKACFVTRHSGPGKFSSYTYGPAGVLASKNLSQLLWDSLVTTQIDTYPVENSVFIKDRPERDARLRSSLSEETLNHMPEILQLVNYTLPFAIVQRGQTFPKTAQYEDKFLFDCNVQTEIVLQYFCSPGSVLQSFDHWIQQRLLWWRKYASNPSQISSSEIDVVDQDTSMACIQCQFPWGQDIVEKIVNKGSNPVDKLQKITETKLQCTNGKKAYTPHLIECTTVLEHCMMACLCDSFTESIIRKGDKSSLSEKFNLHPKIAPYKLSVVCKAKSRLNEIQEVASYINKELRNAGIDVFHAKGSLTTKEQFKRNDLMGMPYTAILDEETLESGVLKLRNKDTSLKEKVHIAHLREVILKNIEF